ncbi:hypothetical protein L202_01856 [Cryptococcus amylolentus CBS 6039]|uniref:Uncharacterized protein n=2 Tax=Cryptococcus amylolentus TaxID=104669 RepID=A0A1E3HYL5_9TREE|nr:hypothetical protein L202_01856 [Cryptococcus amylolentus CBS 6039]ODN81424.1 hypothetical protein L202_01856 [Cryptococcus amylolentus CBS 6039]ODO10334.1 hypothetical protein I350_02563 [Cryptococcus amylolentus CBS 6273]
MHKGSRYLLATRTPSNRTLGPYTFFNDLIHLPDSPPTPTPQRVRCAKLWSELLSSFMEMATQPERKHLVENASKIGRSWLRQIPYFEPLRLSNHEIAAGLHYRLLTPAYSPVCAACANDSDLGHDEEAGRDGVDGLVQGRIVAWLTKRDAEVVDKAPRIYGGAFRPLVLSAGRLMGEETAVEWRSWRKCLEKEVWDGLQSRVGIELVKARARTMWM